MSIDQDRLKAFLERVARPEALEAASAQGAAVDFGLDAGAASAAEAQLATAAVTKLRAGQTLTPPEQFVIEAIIIPNERPAIDVEGGKFRVRHPSWLHFGTADITRRIERAISSTGRIELPGHPSAPYGGTGWVAGPGLLMTNRHVAELFASGLGLRDLRFLPDRGAALDLEAERASTREPTLLRVSQVVMIHPYWDMALLRVEGLPPSARPLELSVTEIESLEGRDVAVVGYPAFDPRNPADVQNRVFGGVYNVKRLQPGKLGRILSVESFGKFVRAASHDASTLGGNSGSLVLDVASGDVVGLHFGGRYLAANYAVPAAELARDGRVIDAGVSFRSNDRRGPTDWDDWWRDGETTLRISAGTDGAGASQTCTIPLELSVRVGIPTATGSGAETEAMVEPIHDSDLRSRKGFDTGFLGADLPLPTVPDESLCAPVEGGGHLLHYHHFSIAMHRRRRLALFTASNIDTRPAVRRPEPDRDYSRRGLSGLRENDREKWFPDPRIAPEHQLPDRFFTKDRQAFDKGHLVRREDVAWGRSYDEVRFANGDTYHTTNCSPQVLGFNQSQRGKDNWGDLENFVLAQAKTEKLSVLAGPVLATNDRLFKGVDDDGPVEVKIPRSFWKVVVAAEGEALRSFAFLLKQDLSDVDFEFTVGGTWKRFMLPSAELEKKLQIRFPAAIHDSDQSGSSAGARLRYEANVGWIPRAAPRAASPALASTARGSANPLESVANYAHDSVRALLQGGRGLRPYLRSIDRLSPADRATIVDQAILLLEGYYAHLPLKRAMHAVDPVQRLKLLRRRLKRYESEFAFHNELTDTFTSLRDLHTLYVLPDYFAQAVAMLPFRVKFCHDDGGSAYVVTETLQGISDPDFRVGVTLTHWNAVPIERAIEIAASYHAGSNPAARHARGVDGLTLRMLAISLPPDEEWVVVGYTDENGTQREARFEWTVLDVPAEEDGASDAAADLAAASALGVDIEAEMRRRMNAILFAPEKVQRKQQFRRARQRGRDAVQAAVDSSEAVAKQVADEVAVRGLESTLSDVLDARALPIAGAKYGYLRIRTFSVPDDVEFVSEVARLVTHPEMPQNGLILDVRGNGGGLIWAGERLLQLFTGAHIEPTRAQFFASPATAQLAVSDDSLAPWRTSLDRAIETGAVFSSAHPITPPERCNDLGRRYPGPVVLITDARCYSTTDMFAAGFQDHGIGKILGVDDSTGAGGANVWTVELLRRFLGNSSPFSPLPRHVGMRVAIRRTLRVGDRAGQEIEDLGVTPDHIHRTTRRDLLEHDIDLVEAAAKLLVPTENG